MPTQSPARAVAAVLACGLSPTHSSAPYQFPTDRCWRAPGHRFTYACCSRRSISSLPPSNLLRLPFSIPSRTPASPSSSDWMLASWKRPREKNCVLRGATITPGCGGGEGKFLARLAGSFSSSLFSRIGLLLYGICHTFLDSIGMQTCQLQTDPPRRATLCAPNRIDLACATFSPRPAAADRAVCARGSNDSPHNVIFATRRGGLLSLCEVKNHPPHGIFKLVCRGESLCVRRQGRLATCYLPSDPPRRVTCCARKRTAPLYITFKVTRCGWHFVCIQ